MNDQQALSRANAVLADPLRPAVLPILWASTLSLTFPDPT